MEVNYATTEASRNKCSLNFVFETYGCTSIRNTNGEFLMHAAYIYICNSENYYGSLQCHAPRLYAEIKTVAMQGQHSNCRLKMSL